MQLLQSTCLYLSILNRVDNLAITLLVCLVFRTSVMEESLLVFFFLKSWVWAQSIFLWWVSFSSFHLILHMFVDLVILEWFFKIIIICLVAMDAFYGIQCLSVMSHEMIYTFLAFNAIFSLYCNKEFETGNDVQIYCLCFKYDHIFFAFYLIKVFCGYNILGFCGLYAIFFIVNLVVGFCSFR